MYNQIAEVMRRRGMTQAQLARALGMGDGNLHRVMHANHGRYMVDILFKAARVLEVPAYYLMPGYDLPPLEAFSLEHIEAIAPRPARDQVAA